MTSHQFDAWNDANGACQDTNDAGMRTIRSLLQSQSEREAAVNTLKDVLSIAEAVEATPARDAVFRIARIVRHALERLGVSTAEGVGPGRVEIGVNRRDG